MEKTYELLYIVSTKYTDDEVENIRKTVKALIEKLGGKIVREESLAKIRLSYIIKKQRHGTYVLAYFTAPPAAMAELDRQLGLTDEILRHTVLALAKSADLKKTFDLTAYIAPLSEEAQAARGDSRDSRPRSAAPAAAPMVPGTAPVKAEPAMSIEELDKKLDQILEGDVTK